MDVIANTIYKTHNGIGSSKNSKEQQSQRRQLQKAMTPKSDDSKKRRLQRTTTPKNDNSKERRFQRNQVISK
ncbi:hypothetical protein C2G38_2224644 [Gigaspora rosea]|uniref:Uncharacterized protein n=1 Tax=Gigaspora rosea TaxID=44941 RepID=A0A397U1Q0_9GLOM|nr:hypothetical protein C2G38_2224644 [Gigaspora rosea]